MNTLNFPDVNVWMALLWGQHVHSEHAREWFQRAAGEQFFFCRFTQLGVLRLLTTSTIMGKDTKSMSEAWAVLDRLGSDQRISFLSEPEGTDSEFRSRSRLSTASPRVWADAYLLAFACVAGLKFVTFDRALKSQGSDVLVL
jgi:toxin-antitoxin system PIN domain toxin